MLDEKTSKSIYSLRFFLAVLITMTHSKFNISEYVNRFNIADATELPFGIDFIQHIFSGFIFIGCAVPLFFVFSAYLFYQKPIDSVLEYKKMLIKKLKTIVLPYVLWIFLYLFLYFVASIFKYTRKPFLGREISEYFAWFLGFPKLNDYFHPIIGQFWYLRELMLMFVLSPLIFFAIKKYPVLYFTLAITFRLSTLPLAYEFGNAFLYFGLGCLAAQKGITVSSINFKIKDLSIAYFLIILLQFINFLYMRLNNYTEETILLCKNLFSCISFFNIIVGSVLLLKIAEKLIQNDKVFAVLKNLSTYSFWIFAIHMPWILEPTKRILIKFFQNKSYGIFAIYFITLIFVPLLSLLTGIVCKKLFPKLFKFLCGSR